MQVLLIALGTDGDVVPYTELGATLRSRGHQVRLLATERYASLAAKHGLEFAPLLTDAQNDELMDHPDFWDARKTIALSAKWGVRYIAEQYQTIARFTGPDTVLISNPAVFGAGLVHEKQGVPLVNLALQPWVIPSAIAPPLMPTLEFLRFAPTLAWKFFIRVIEGMGDKYLATEINRIRRELGLKPGKRFLAHWFSKDLVICMFPEWFARRQMDWPEAAKLVGFPEPIATAPRELPAEVAEFCAAGEKPVAFTFGTGMRHSSDLFRAALDACKVLHIRGIMLTKFRDQLPDALPPNILHAPYAPFERLFPLCSAVVHHGGVGTTARAFQTGTPQLIHPICFDQRDNGVRVEKLGAGACLSGRAAGGRAVAARLRSVLIDETRLGAERVQGLCRSANAYSDAADLVEELVERKKQNVTTVA